MSNAHLSAPAPTGPAPATHNEQQSANDASGFSSALSGQRGGSVRAGDARVDQHLQPTWLHHAPAGPVSGGGQRAPGAGRADGGLVRAAGGRGADGEPRFDQKVPDGGYLWWYVDAMSDDGQHGITLIAFVGKSV